MSYAHPHASGRRFTGLIVTVALHIALIYALIHGLARKIVEVVAPLLETKIIAEVKPPQPEKPPPPPPKLATPPPPFIPPPEVNIQIPVQQAPTITAVTPTPPPPPQPVRTAPVVLASSCDKPEYPPAARRANETGTVLLSFLIDTNGKVISSKVERSSGSRRLDEAAREGLGLCKFRPATVNGVPQQAWARIEYVWRLE